MGTHRQQRDDQCCRRSRSRSRSQGLLRFVDRYRKVADLPAPQLQSLALSPLLADVQRLIILFNRAPQASVFRLDLPPADTPDPCPRSASP